MAKINIQAGDIPETDQEVEQELRRMARNAVRRGKGQKFVEERPKYERQAKRNVAKKKTVERQLEHEELQDWVESAATPEEMQERAEHANAGYPVMVKEEVDDAVANHEPGQALPEDAAERAASGSGWQGEEITDEEWEKMQKAKKPQLQVVRKNSKGQEVQVAKKPAVKSEAKKSPKTRTPKQPKAKARKAQRTETVSGHSFVTIEMIEQLFADAAKGLSNKELAQKYNLAISRVSRILTGSRGFDARLERRAKREGRPDWKYPDHPFQPPKSEKSEAEVKA